MSLENNTSFLSNRRNVYVIFNVAVLVAFILWEIIFMNTLLLFTAGIVLVFPAILLIGNLNIKNSKVLNTPTKLP